MSMNDYSDEEKKKYENEFSEFLSQRIENVGGTLQFQHLNALLPQCSREVRNAVAASKVQLMKFLKAHPKRFKVDPKGIVTVIDSSTSEDNDKRYNENSTVVKSSLPATIEKGKGRISRIHSSFGFINGIEPIETTVYFTAVELGGDKDSLLIDFPHIQFSDDVYFNAIIGHNDCNAKYRATKVWKRNDTEQENSNTNKRSQFQVFPIDNKSDIASSVKELQDKQKEEFWDGSGVIQRVDSNRGFISVAGKEGHIIFYKSDLIDCDSEDLKSGDQVEFYAVEIRSKDSKTQWKAITVRKKSKARKQKQSEKYAASDLENSGNLDKKSFSNSRSEYKDKHNSSAKDMLKTEPGKIFPLTRGADIKFGSKFDKLANGNSSAYFLYGAQVTDIAWEFSMGDDILFDAVKVKEGWKALLVFVGERPDFDSFKEFNNKDTEEIPDSNSDTSASNKNFSNSSHPSVKSRSKSSNHKEFKGKTLESSGHPKHRFAIESDVDNKRLAGKSSQSSSQSSLSSIDSYNRNHRRKFKNNDFVSTDTKHKVKIRHDSPENYKHVYDNNTHKNRQKTMEDDIEPQSQNASNYQSSKYKYTETHKYRRNRDKSPENYHNISKNNGYKNRQKMFKDQNDVETQSASNYLHQMDKREFKEKSTNHIKDKFLNTHRETEIEENEVITKYSETMHSNASIKIHKGINAEITKVRCKIAHAKNPDLQGVVHFLQNVFYYNGQSVDEQQLEDLREIIFIGSIVTLNCFEIVDDVGKYHNKVTIAWIGSKPNVSEITPEKFILENDLSVTIKEEAKDIQIEMYENVSKKYLVVDNSDFDNDEDVFEDAPKKIFSVHKSDSDDEVDESFLITRSSDDSSEDEMSSKYSNALVASNCEAPKKDSELPSVNYKVLSEIVSQKLESKGLSCLNSEVNLKTLSAEIIDLVLKHHNAEESNQQNSKLEASDLVCSICKKKSIKLSFSENMKKKHTEVQTIITGDIVAQTDPLQHAPSFNVRYLSKYVT